MIQEEDNYCPISLRNPYNYNIKILSDFENLNQLTIYPQQELGALLKIDRGMKPYFEIIKDKNNKVVNYYLGMVDINF